MIASPLLFTRYIPEPQPGDILGKLGYVREKEDPQTNYRCLPFPHGCEHMMHMCAIMQQDQPPQTAPSGED